MNDSSRARGAGAASTLASDWPDFGLTLDTGPAVLQERALCTHVGVAFRGQSNAMWRVNTAPTRRASFSPGTSWVYGQEGFVWARIPADHHCLNISVKPDRLRRIALENGLEPVAELRPEYFLHDTRLFHIASLIRLELLDPAGGDEAYRKTLSDLLAVHLLKHYCDTAAAAHFHRSPLSPLAMRRVKSFVDDHLDRRISLDDMAAIANMSTYYFAHAFRDSAGVPPHRYLVQRRMDRACVLLRNTRLSVAEIAWKLGYSNQSHFTQLFKREIGVTPSRFRHQS